MSDIESIGNGVRASAERLGAMHRVIGELITRAQTSQGLLDHVLVGNSDGTRQEVASNMEEALKVLGEAYDFAALAAERLDTYARNGLRTGSAADISHTGTPQISSSTETDSSTPRSEVLTGQLLPPRQGLEPGEYEPGENRKVRDVLGGETSCREAHKRLAHFLAKEDNAPSWVIYAEPSQLLVS